MSSLFVTVALRYSGLVLQFVLLALLARYLDPGDYGRYMLVLSAVLPTYFALGFGVSEAFVREAPQLLQREDRDGLLGRLVGTTCAVAVVSALSVALIGGMALWLLPLDHQTGVVAAFAVALFIANGLMFNGAQILLGVGSETLGAFFFYPAVNLGLVITVIPYLILTDTPTFAGTALTTSVSALLSAAIAFAGVLGRVRLQKPKLGEAWRLASLGFRLSLARALYAAGIWLPTFVAGIVLTPLQAGSLGTAGRVAIAVGAVMAAFRFAVRPAIIRAFAAKDRHEIKRICGALSGVSLALACVALILSSLIGPQVLAIGFGHHYVSAAPLVTILLFGVVIEAYAGPVDEVLKMTGSEKAVLVIFAVAVPISTAGLLVAAHYGVTAMAWVQVLYTLTVFGTMLFAVRRALGIWLHPTFPEFIAARFRREPVERVKV